MFFAGVALLANDEGKLLRLPFGLKLNGISREDGNRHALLRDRNEDFAESAAMVSIDPDTNGATSSSSETTRNRGTGLTLDTDTLLRQSSRSRKPKR
jgi:hypothetical protein